MPATKTNGSLSEKIVYSLEKLLRKFKISRQREWQKYHSKQSIHILLNFIAIIPTCSLFHFLLELIPKDTLQVQRERRKICCHLFISPTKPKIRQLHIVVKQWWQRSVPKSVIQVQICCFLVADATMTS